MSQLFHRATNPLSKASIFGGVFILAALVYVFDRIYKSPYVNQQRVIREQPVPFSHEHHVRGLGIDCRYCHTSVETSAFAGMPPVKTCMTCHSQIWTNAAILEPVRESFRTGKPLKWVRVNSLPDYAYFDHSIHVAKGIGCTTCHGPVGNMPLPWREATLHMKWCLDCHRHPEQFVRPKQEVFSVDFKPPHNQILMGRDLVQKNNIKNRTDCYTCHR